MRLWEGGVTTALEKGAFSQNGAQVPNVQEPERWTPVK